MRKGSSPSSDSVRTEAPRRTAHAHEIDLPRQGQPVQLGRRKSAQEDTGAVVLVGGLETLGQVHAVPYYRVFEAFGRALLADFSLRAENSVIRSDVDTAAWNSGKSLLSN